jgi:hypothetical protein
MILFLTALQEPRACAEAMARATGMKVEVAGSRRRALSLMRAGEHAAVVLDQVLLEREPELGDAVVQHAAAAVPVYVNCAIQDGERVVRQVTAALRRRAQQREAALRAAAWALRSELKGALTGILLSSQLALSAPALPAEVAARLKSVCELAEQMRLRLEA